MLWRSWCSKVDRTSHNRPQPKYLPFKMMKIKMRRSQLFIKESFYRTKRFFHTTVTNLKSFISKGYQKLPKTPTTHTPIYSCNNNVSSKLEVLDSFYKDFCQHWDSRENANKGKDRHVSPKQTGEHCSKRLSSITECILDDLDEGNVAKNSMGIKQEDSGYLSAQSLAQKMKELEMMDVKDVDHLLDVEEVLHYYSRLTCPAYVEIVDKFFMDMYSELSVPEQSRSGYGSTGNFGSSSVNSSITSQEPLRILTDRSSKGIHSITSTCL